MTSNEILKIEYDKIWNQYDRDEFESLYDSISSNVYSEYAYCLYVHCAYDKRYCFYNIRIYELQSIDGRYIIFVGPAIKKTEIGMAKVTVPVVVNKLNLVKGQVVSIDDLPPLVLNDKNSYYDPKLKKRVPILTTEDYIKDAVDKAKKKDKTEDYMIKDFGIVRAGQPKQADFLEPRICTRIWTLGIGIESGWGWFMRAQEGYKNKFEFYCRPIEAGFGMEEYDSGGSFVTNAYMKWEYPTMDKDVIKHDNLSKYYKEFGSSTDAQLTLNILIDAYLINWKL